MKKRIIITLALAVLGTAAFLFSRPSHPANAAPAAAMPDLVVRAETLGDQWVVREENLGANFCSVIEGGITPGVRKLLRFTVMTANIGTADLHVGDTDPNPAWYPTGAPKAFKYRSCGAIGVPGNQGISVGWTDTYRFTLGGQYFVLDGGDGQEPVPAGEYVIRIHANPGFAAKKGQACPNRDSFGLCHTLPESNYDNNVATAVIQVPDHPGREGVGPLKGSEHVTEEKPEHSDICDTCGNGGGNN